MLAMAGMEKSFRRSAGDKLSPPPRERGRPEFRINCPLSRPYRGTLPRLAGEGKAGGGAKENLVPPSLLGSGSSSLR
jgi:hypothetical protein